ncbi:hypothetical protein [Methylobacterium sp. P1-11]|nr:hypothetical protein [Methylobacterium sp. P1-11]
MTAMPIVAMADEFRSVAVSFRPSLKRSARGFRSPADSIGCATVSSTA